MKRVPWAALALVALLAAGCSGAPAVEPGFPVEVEGTVIARAPARIVSASASHTEILFSIGAGEQVVATDRFSDFPAAAAGTSKFDAFSLGVETVASFEPDLVVISFDPGELQKGLTSLGIPTLMLPAPATLDDVYHQIEVLGQATGHREEAARLVAQMAGDVEEIVRSVPPGREGGTYYYELDPTFYSLTSGTFVGSLLGLLGLESIADAADDGSGYPQLSAEFILETDPDFILLADTRCCGQSAAALADRPGWSSLAAVAGGRVVDLDDDVAQRWGPRVVDLLAAVASALDGAR